MDPETRYATGLLAELRDRDVPPLDVDVDRAMNTGRRRVRIRRAAVAGLAAATGLLAVAGVLVALDPATGPAPDTATGTATGATRGTDPPAAGGPRACTVRALAVPAGERHVSATAVDPTGRYVVGYAAASEETGEQGAALLWDAGTVASPGDKSGTVASPGDTSGIPRKLPVPGFAAAASAVNAAGTVAGTVTRNHDLVAWVYRDGQVTTLPTLDGRPSSASGINERGDIVGTVYGADDVTRAVLWPADRPGTVRVLAAPGAAGAVAVAADGTVVGYGNGMRPYLWQPDGTGRELPVPAGVVITQVRGIAGDWAVGVANEAPNPDSQPAVRWNLRDGRAATVPAVAPSAVTTDGVVIGTGGVPGPDRPHTGAVRVDGSGTVTALPHVDPHRNTGFAIGATPDGRVIVGGESDDGSTTPVRWDC
jgi:uncharacterized membrane protein